MIKFIIFLFLDVLAFSGILISTLPFLINNYGGDIFIITLAFGSFSFFQFFVSPFWGGLSDKFGRKPLLAISSFLMCISVIPLGVFFYLDEHKNCNGTITTNCEENSDIDPQTDEDIGWLPLVCLIVYALAFSLGLGPLPWAVNAEMFPQEAKEKGSLLIAM